VLSPSTGIIDTHGLMLSLRGELEAAGGAVALLSPVESVALGADAHRVEVSGESAMALSAPIVINAAGLWAPSLASRFEGLPDGEAPRAWFAKGSYFTLSGKAPFTRLIYPMPDAAGLGVHLTLDLGGQARFGPDVEWIDPDSADDIDYRVDPARADAFYAEIRRYWPEPARWRAAAGLQRRAAEARRPGRCGERLRHPRSGRARACAAS
jgi:L-2-hydroxyglutarate oxidase LhgO